MIIHTFCNCNFASVVAGYQALLSRICSTATISTPPSGTDVNDDRPPGGSSSDRPPGGTTNNEEEEMSAPVACCPATVANQYVVRLPLYSNTWAIRLTHMHHYCATSLPVSSLKASYFHL